MFERLEDGGRMPNPGKEAAVREGCPEEVVSSERTAEGVQRGLRGEGAGIATPRLA